MSSSKIHTYYNVPKPSEEINSSKNLLSPEFMKSMASSAKLKGNLSKSIEEKDFLKFKENFEIYYKNSYSKENFDFTPSLNSLKILFYYIEGELKDTSVDFFEKANLVTPEAILMILFTQRCNTEISRRLKDTPCNKHEEYWSRGIEISPKYFDNFCECFDKNEFSKQKNEFMDRQNKFIVNHRLNSELREKNTSSSKFKI